VRGDACPRTGPLDQFLQRSLSTPGNFAAAAAKGSPPPCLRRGSAPHLSTPSAPRGGLPFTSPHKSRSDGAVQALARDSPPRRATEPAAASAHASLCAATPEHARAAQRQYPTSPQPLAALLSRAAPPWPEPPADGIRAAFVDPNQLDGPGELCRRVAAATTPPPRAVPAAAGHVPSPHGLLADARPGAPSGISDMLQALREIAPSAGGGSPATKAAWALPSRGLGGAATAAPPRVRPGALAAQAASCGEPRLAAFRSVRVLDACKAPRRAGREDAACLKRAQGKAGAVPQPNKRPRQ